MKKLDSTQLNIKNTMNNISLTESKKLNNPNSDVEIEYVGSFGDAIYDAFGSNKITKGTAMEILKDERFLFFEKDEIEEAIKCGQNNENVKITLKNGDEFLFVPDGMDYKLSTYTSNGNTVHFSNGLYELWDNVLGGNGNGTKIALTDISLYQNMLRIEMYDGISIYYDVSKNNELIMFELNGQYYTISEVKRAIDTLRESLLAPLQEELRRASSGTVLDTHPYIQQLKQKIQDIEEAYTYDNVTDFTFIDNGLKLDGVGRLWYITFENNKATSVVYGDDDSHYVDGHAILDL